MLKNRHRVARRGKHVQSPLGVECAPGGVCRRRLKRAQNRRVVEMFDMSLSLFFVLHRA